MECSVKLWKVMAPFGVYTRVEFRSEFLHTFRHSARDITVIRSYLFISREVTDSPVIT